MGISRRQVRTRRPKGQNHDFSSLTAEGSVFAGYRVMGFEIGSDGPDRRSGRRCGHVDDVGQAERHATREKYVASFVLHAMADS